MAAGFGSSEVVALSAWTDPTPLRPGTGRRKTGRGVATLLILFDLAGVLGAASLRQGLTDSDEPPPPPIPSLAATQVPDVQNPRPIQPVPEPPQPAVESDPVTADQPPAPIVPAPPAANPAQETQPAPATTAEPATEPEKESAKCVRVRDDDGVVRVARLHGGPKSTVVMLPDGRLAWTKGELAFTQEPFVPATADEMADSLYAGPFRDFALERTDNYLLFYQSTPAFAQASGNLLESLLKGLLTQLRAKGFAVDEPEFPLVAVIFRDEAAFRAYRGVPKDVRAYYDVVSNHIVFYQTSASDEEAPDVAARRRPQTVAHEGTHQLLQNVGVQPRLASWPMWLVEGLAEFFAPTTVGKDGSWDGGNKINPFHMATLRDLQDPLTYQLSGVGARFERNQRPLAIPTVQALVTSENLSPIDYALAWALTYYLVNARGDAFIDYLKQMSQIEPLAVISPSEHLAAFCRAFRVAPANLPRLDRQINRFLSGLKGYETLAYFAVTFEQPLGRGVVKRSALVSQSPARIRQWIDEVTDPDGAPPRWHAFPYPNKTRARYAAEQWINRP